MKHSNSANPLQLSRMSTKTPRNGFDMTYRQYFSAPVGQIIPTYVQEVCPKDYLTLDLSSFARTMPCNTASFARMKEVTDFYFVPYHLLWRPFKQLVNPVPDVQSALMTSAERLNTVASVPYFTAEQVAAMMNASNVGTNAIVQEFMGQPRLPFAARLLDMLGYYSDPTKSYQVTGDGTSDGHDDDWIDNFRHAYEDNFKFNPFRILAFNRILSDFYRQTDYTQSVPRRFNIDDLESGSNIPSERLRSLFHVMLNTDMDGGSGYSCFPFKKWSLDKFTSVKPSQLYGTFTAPSNVDKSPLSEFSFDVSNGGVYTSYTGVGGTLNNTQDLRIAHALEKIARVSMSAPKTFRAQQMAHFGTSDASCDNCSPRYLGSYDSSLEISEVTASSNYDGADASSSNYLGEVAGKGTSANKMNRVIKFESDSYGVVMGVHYIIPDAEYQMNRYEPMNTKFTRSDFRVPEFQDLGLQPLYRGQIILDSTIGNQQVVGMQARNIEYKTRVNECHGNFQRQRNLSPWAIPRNIDWTSTDTMSRFFVSPNVTDSIFVGNYNGTELTDQFYCHYKYRAKLVANMSVVGVPFM